MNKFNKVTAILGLVIALSAVMLWGASPTDPGATVNVLPGWSQQVFPDSSSDTLMGATDSAYLLKNFAGYGAYQWIYARPAYSTLAVGASSATGVIYFDLHAKDNAGKIVGIVAVDTMAAGKFSTPQQIVIPIGKILVGSKYDFIAYTKHAADSFVIQPGQLYYRIITGANKSINY